MGAFPGKHPYLKTNHFNSIEKKIIDKLSKEFYITNGGAKINLGKTSQYKYILIKPTDNYIEMFNLEREIIVIFSFYRFFEPRTLDAIDYVSKIIQKLRLEKICSVVISGDNKVEKTLEGILKKDVESQIVIPFTYEEIINNKSEYFFRNKFKKHFYTRDLFAFESPLKKDLYFFGRTHIIHKIINRHKSNENSGLFGLRKTGKTSVIFGIERTMESTGALSIYIDCQNPAINKRKWNKALFYIIFLIGKKYDINNPEQKGFSAEKDYTELNAPILFEKDIKILFNHLGKKNILLIFDEIENISFDISPSKNWCNDLDFIYFWQTLRSIFQKLNNVFSYLVVGTNAMCIEKSTVGGKDNPLFNSIPFEYIGRFTVTQTKEMVVRLGSMMGLQFDESIYTYLTDDFGGHPFLMRHVCSTMNSLVHEQRPALISKEIYRKAKEQFNLRYSNYIEMILNVLKIHYYEEYRMLELLALGQMDEFSKYVLHNPILTSHLLNYGVIDRDNKTYYFRIDSVKEYLIERLKYSKIELTDLEKRAEISERRNRLEEKLRILVRNQLAIKFGKVEATKLFLKVMEEKRREKHLAKSYYELFDANKSEIYFSDLKIIIEKKWSECFENIFDKDLKSFSSKMDTINKFRKPDAHAGSISKDDFILLRISFKWIEEKIDYYT